MEKIAYTLLLTEKTDLQSLLNVLARHGHEQTFHRRTKRSII